MKIYYQGIPGSFSSIAAKKFFPSNDVQDFLGIESFTKVFEHIKNSDVAVIPIENTIAGSIHENYDHLFKHKNLQIVGEISIHIEHNLLGIKGTHVKNITKVFSHYKALEQCQNFFDEHKKVEEVVYFDTAGAAEYISKENRKDFASISSKDAAKLYNLEILLENIEDNKENLTRFIVIRNGKPNWDNGNKCSLVFSVHHRPHSLQSTLNILASVDANLTKIESRPLIGNPFEYLFYVDLEFADTNKTKLGIQTLSTIVPYLRILGIYTKNG